MASVNEINQEIQAWANANPGLNPFDGVRKQKIANLKRLTQRPVLIYAADFLTPKVQLAPALQNQIAIGLRDKDYLPDVASMIPGKSIDFIIQSPGGLAEATETLVDHLRSRFDDIRVIVPGTAKSAATMLAMCADQIVMDELSELGPTDPQMFVNGRYSPAGAILKQFNLAQEALKNDPSSMAAWLPVLQMYGPSLIMECQHHLDLSRNLVGTWLKQYMFKADAALAAKADEIAAWLTEDDNFLTHNRRVSVTALREKGVNVLDMSTEPALQNAVRELYYAIMATFDGTGAFKLFENSENQLLSLGVVVQIAQAVPLPGQPGGGAPMAGMPLRVGQ
jgi:hypothetical protein